MNPILYAAALYFTMWVLIESAVVERPRDRLFDLLDARWPWGYNLASCRICAGWWISLAVLAPQWAPLDADDIVAIVAINGAHLAACTIESVLVRYNDTHPVMLNHTLAGLDDPMLGLQRTKLPLLDEIDEDWQPLDEPDEPAAPEAGYDPAAVLARLLAHDRESVAMFGIILDDVRAAAPNVTLDELHRTLNERTHR